MVTILHMQIFLQKNAKKICFLCLCPSVGENRRDIIRPRDALQIYLKGQPLGLIIHAHRAIPQKGFYWFLSKNLTINSLTI